MTRSLLQFDSPYKITPIGELVVCRPSVLEVLMAFLVWEFVWEGAVSDGSDRERIRITVNR